MSCNSSLSVRTVVESRMVNHDETHRPQIYKIWDTYDTSCNSSLGDRAVTES